MTDIKSLTLDELTKEMEAIGEKKFRAAQIYSWMHERLADDFDQMTNLSKNLREKLKENYELTRLELVQVQTSKIDGTSKFLFRLSDGNVIESVLMKYHHGNSVCISSQVGCRMGCRFCASTLDGLERGLKPSEMLDQIYQIMDELTKQGKSIILISTDLPEVIGMSDRVVIMREGYTVLEIDKSEMNQEKILAYASGGVSENE